MTTIAPYHQPTAREMTHQEAEELAEEAFALDREVKATLAEGRAAAWRLAEALYRFDDANGWRWLGGYDTLSDWLADPEVGMTRAQYYRYVKVWRELVIERRAPVPELATVDLSKAEIVLPAIKGNRVLVDDALDDARELGQRDLREKYRPGCVSSDETGSPEPELEPDTPEPARRADDLDEPVEPEVEDLVRQDLDAEEPCFPGWVTPEVRAQAIKSLDRVLGTEASYPRVERQACKAAREALRFVDEWLASRRQG